MPEPATNPQAPKDHPSKPAPAPPSRFSTVLPIVNLAVLLAALGLLGYVIYEARKEAKADQPVREAAGKAEKEEHEIKPDVDKLKSQVKDLSRTVEERPAPPNYAPQIKALDDRAADLGKSLANATDRLDALGKQIDALTRGEGLEASPRFQGMEKQVGDLSRLVDSLRAQLAGKVTTAAVAGDEMDLAVSLFKQAKYAEARDAFVRLEGALPDDARVYYYAALANGLATKDWKGESERLVAEGMAREKAGKPDKAKIDATFADLSATTGKDWLGFYRSRAGSAPEHR